MENIISAAGRDASCVLAERASFDVTARGVARILVWGYKFSRFSVHGCNKLIAPRYSPQVVRA